MRCRGVRSGRSVGQVFHVPHLYGWGWWGAGGTSGAPLGEAYLVVVPCVRLKQSVAEPQCMLDVDQQTAQERVSSSPVKVPSKALVAFSLLLLLLLLQETHTHLSLRTCHRALWSSAHTFLAACFCSSLLAPSLFPVMDHAAPPDPHACMRDARLRHRIPPSPAELPPGCKINAHTSAQQG